MAQKLEPQSVLPQPRGKASGSRFPSPITCNESASTTAHHGTCERIGQLGKTVKGHPWTELQRQRGSLMRDTDSAWTSREGNVVHAAHGHQRKGCVMQSSM